ncbi:wax ester synthase/diacylglycerol acyltransferase 11-like [Silene latifolia]|uniref:wax ester synthase/diacylglycerol acyltransferase 11-like n=1 Tax=Silene latifolia TaxID=37657 RepID=UPI003D772435
MESVISRRKRGVIKPIEVKPMSKDEVAMFEEEEEPLSPGSLIFHRPTFNIHILAIMGCRTPINVDLIKAKLPLTLLKHPRFSSLVVGDASKGEELKWVRTEVNLDNHIIIPKINLENNILPEKYVDNYIYNLSKTSLDKSRPLWDFHILHVKTSEETQAIGMFRIHHSLGDGSSLVSLLLALMRKMSNPEELPTIPPQKTSKNKTRNDEKGVFWRRVLGLWWVLTLCWNTLVDVALFVATTVFLKDDSPLKIPSVFTPRRVVYKMVSLDDLKLVKNAMAATINDVALGVTEAGLSKYLSRKYGNEVNKHKSKEQINKLLKKMRLRSVLLINLRPSGGIQALSDMMEKDAEAKWGNAVGYVILPFTLALRDNPLDYIREAKATVDRKKHSLEALLTYSISEFVMKLFGTKVASVLSHRINTHTTMCFSNLVGPLEEIGFYGHPMSFLAPTSYGQPHGLMINFQSYVNKMTIVISVDEDTVSDPHQLGDDIVESLKVVKGALIAQGLAKDGIAS